MQPWRINLGISSSSGGSELFEEIARRFGDVLKIGVSMNLDLPEDDPRVSQVVSFLDSHSVQRTGFEDQYAENSYFYRRYVPYEVLPLEEYEYLTIRVKNQLNKKISPSAGMVSREGVVYIPVEDYEKASPRCSIFEVPYAPPVVKQSLRDELVSEGFDSQEFVLGQLYSRHEMSRVKTSRSDPTTHVRWQDWTQDEPLWAWNPTKVLPGFHPETYLLSSNSKRTGVQQVSPRLACYQPLGRPAIYPRDDGPFRVAAPHYLRKDIEGVKPFDFATTLEPIGIRHVVSRRVYQFLENRNPGDFYWAPVIVHES